MKKIIYSLAFIFLLSGCAALVIGSAAAVGTYTYKSGNLESTYNANLIATYNATIQACNTLNIFISKKRNWPEQRINQRFRKRQGYMDYIEDTKHNNNRGIDQSRLFR